MTSNNVLGSVWDEEFTIEMMMAFPHMFRFPDDS